MDMDKIVISGRGLITPLGNGLDTNVKHLKEGKSGIVFMSKWAEIGLNSRVAGVADESPQCPLLDKKRKRFASPNSQMAVAAAYEALCEADLDPEHLKNHRIALIIGCAGSAYMEIVEQTQRFLDSRKVKRVSPFIVPRVMPSSACANLSLILGITGETYDISSACASSAHAIMLAVRLLKLGLYDIVISGGSEEVNWVQALGFDAMRALSTRYNETPEKASRPFDKDRDGFVIAEGAGIIVLETLRHAKTRGVSPKAFISGLSANSNAADMVVPNVNANKEVMKMAIEDAGLRNEDIDYINTHGTATPTGDTAEMESIKQLFKDYASEVAVTSTKSMTGHMIGATGAVEIIFCTLMMEHNFIAPSLNIDNVEEGMEWANLIKETKENVRLNHCLSNSFGFGGTNISVVISNKECY